MPSGGQKTPPKKHQNEPQTHGKQHENHPKAKETSPNQTNANQCAYGALRLLKGAPFGASRRSHRLCGVLLGCTLEANYQGLVLHMASCTGSFSVCNSLPTQGHFPRNWSAPCSVESKSDSTENGLVQGPLCRSAAACMRSFSEEFGLHA